MAITAHQGEFQRVTKLLRALHMIDLQFFPLVSSLKSQGGEATVFMTAHHHFTIKYMLVFTGDFFKCMKLIKTHIWNAEAFQPVRLTYLRWCLLTGAQAKYSTTIRSRWNNRNETLKTESVSVFIWKSSLWLLCCRPAEKMWFSNPFQYLMNRLPLKIDWRNIHPYSRFLWKIPRTEEVSNLHISLRISPLMSAVINLKITFVLLYFSPVSWNMMKSVFGVVLWTTGRRNRYFQKARLTLQHEGNQSIRPTSAFSLQNVVTLNHYTICGFKSIESTCKFLHEKPSFSLTNNAELICGNPLPETTLKLF